MNWDELLSKLGLINIDIIVTIIKPVRNDDIYKTGKVIGFKPGVFGGGHSNWRKDKQKGDGAISVPHSFDSRRIHCIKKPKVLVEYNIFTFGGRTHWDWIEIDNCIFEIKTI